MSGTRCDGARGRAGGPQGGAEIHLLRLLTGLARRGWTITLTTPGEGPLARCGAARPDTTGSRSRSGARARARARALVVSWPRARRLAREPMSSTSTAACAAGCCRRSVPAPPDGCCTSTTWSRRVPRFWSRADVVLADSAAVAARLPGLAGPRRLRPRRPDPPQAPAPWPRTAATARSSASSAGSSRARDRSTSSAPRPRSRRASPTRPVVIVGDDPYGTDRAYTSTGHGRSRDRAPSVDRQTHPA